MVNIFDVHQHVCENNFACFRIIFILLLDITKFFAYEFSTSVRINEKEDSYIIVGNRDSETLQNTFDKFIEHFVLCPRCGNPETELVCIILRIKPDFIKQNFNLSV